jgi:hypothetical protein
MESPFEYAWKIVKEEFPVETIDLSTPLVSGYKAKREAELVQVEINGKWVDAYEVTDWSSGLTDYYSPKKFGKVLMDFRESGDHSLWSDGDLTYQVEGHRCTECGDQADIINQVEDRGFVDGKCWSCRGVECPVCEDNKVEEGKSLCSECESVKRMGGDFI